MLELICRNRGIEITGLRADAYRQLALLGKGKDIIEYSGELWNSCTPAKLELEPMDNTTANEVLAPLNQILFGPPGTGKTYNTINHALEICGEDLSELDRNEIKALYDQKVKQGQIVFTTFHQSMTYEDFVEGIKPQEPKEDEDRTLTYAVEDGIFKRLCKQASPTYGNYEEVIEKFKKEVAETDNQRPLTIKGNGTTFDVKYKGKKAFYILTVTKSTVEEAKPTI